MITKLAAILTALGLGLAALVLSASTSSAAWQPPIPQGPYDSDPGLKVAVVDPGTGGVRPTAAVATNTRTLGDNTPIVISTSGPCTYSASTGKIAVTGVGTCVVRATQAAGPFYIAGLTERSYLITRL